LEEVDGGAIYIGDRDVTDDPPKKRDIAMVFQNYALYPYLTVAANIGFPLKIAGVKKDVRERKVLEAAKMLGLTEYLERKPGQLSGGQRQRVAMGRAIVRQPQVFLFDEPLSNLDAQLRVQMRFEIQKLHTRVPTTSIYVTHDQVEAMTLADRVMVMNAGRVEQIGPPMTIYSRPESLFVAGFIGSPSMNRVKGRVDSTGGAIAFEDGSTFRLPGAPIAAWQGRTLVVGMRPEHLERDDSAVPGLSLRAEVVEPLGADTLVHGTLGGGLFIVRLPGGDPVAANETVPLRIARDRLHFFDADSGRRIEPGEPATRV
ncbi:MAG TPA: ATP-binding cassette domain-containing protein, partial [Caldimonas sp.]|nr:ATP-binding cassette domain-containing protein [Caldimonas sp.]